MTIGERIKQLRKEKKISAEKLAAELGLSKTTIYRYEDSSIKKIPVDIINGMCRIFEISVNELMGISDNLTVETKNSQTDPILAAGYGGMNPSEEQQFMLEMYEQQVLISLKTPEDAIKFIMQAEALKDYSASFLAVDEATREQFTADILQQIKLVSYKYNED